MQHSFRTLCWIAGFSIFSAARASNLVPNPDFDDGLDGWSMLGTDGVMTLDSADGFPAQPSIHLSPGTNPVLGSGAQSACIAADDTTRYDFFMNATASGHLFGGIEAFSDSECSTLIGSTETESFPGSGWSTYGLTNFVLPAGTHGARAIVAASVGPMEQSSDGHFDHILFGATGTLLTGININQEGLTGSWYNPTTSGQGLQLVVQPDANTDTGILFGTWYTYDVEAGGADTQRWYSIQASVSSNSTTASVVIYKNTGGKFDTPPATTAVPVGTGTVQFSSCTFGEFTYELDDGRSGAVAIGRLLPNTDCVETGQPTNAPSDSGFSGAWYDAQLGGQGFIIDVSPNTGNGVFTQIFAGWYTYAADGAPSDGAASQRWFTAQGPNTIGAGSSSLSLYESTGGTFDSSATSVETDPVGTAILTFDSCTSATFAYDFDAGELAGSSGSITLSRLGATPASCAVPN